MKMKGRQSMPSPRSLAETLRDLRAVEALKSSLVKTAPVAVAAAGGADTLIARLGKHTRAGFWGLRPMPEYLWEAMAAEHAQGQRALE